MSVMKKGRKYSERRSESHGGCASAYLQLETGNTLPNQTQAQKEKEKTVRNEHVERKVVAKKKKGGKMKEQQAETKDACVICSLTFS